MNIALAKHAAADTWFEQAERKAARYFETLYMQVKDQSYVPVLSEDFQKWKRGHIQPYSWLGMFSKGNRKPDTKDYNRYVRWLNYTGKLDDYLDRSISYIYMRDLGKALDQPHTRQRIDTVVAYIQKHLIGPEASPGGGQPHFLSIAGLYRWSQREGVENAAIWVIHKLKSVSAHIPEGMSSEHAVRKLIKIILGVVLHVIEEMSEGVPPAERSKRLDEAIRLGYSYGLTYPFIDDLLDSEVLSPKEKELYSRLIREALLKETAPDIADWTGSNPELMRFVYGELKEAFDYVKNYQRSEMKEAFFEQSYVFFHSQEMDRAKKLDYTRYTNEDLYLPVILKSSSSRLIVRSVISADADEGFDQHTFYYGIYNQLADDFADLFDDMSNGAVTPYTYYLKYREERSDLINPYEMYWTVISNLIHNVYRSDDKTREVILDRAINGLKRCKERVGVQKYNELMDIFASGSPEFNRIVQQMVSKADDVDFFDKLIRDQMVAVLRNDKNERDHFVKTVKSVRDQINSELEIASDIDGYPEMKKSMIDAANFSLQGSGKRLRPIVSWVMGVEEYGLSAKGIIPLLRSLEYMHTASLIFDDLPSQDNASTRRGRPTLHQVHNSATAELTGLYLIQKAIEEQSSLTPFDPKAILALMKYSSQKAADMCMGQAMDLHSKGKALTLEELNTICFYKTGIAFEASLIMPAILAGVKPEEKEALKTYAYHAGIAFQIKDDLLDLEGDVHLLGKPTGQDSGNNNSTFVTVLGKEGAGKEMWNHYCLAMEQLQAMPRPSAFLKHLLNYFVNRDR
ncbi:polyprenyl synthetase family protein [Paenibacillus sp. GCM10027627]|uniref:polyprenyl synthetase family protein n=1 Tax=unclassified Paenibacillus TaxID=185978 RepID=UPI00362FD545